MINKSIIGRQYGYRRNALRAIRNFKVKHFASVPNGYQFWVNQIDDGCYAIEGMPLTAVWRHMSF